MSEALSLVVKPQHPRGGAYKRLIPVVDQWTTQPRPCGRELPVETFRSGIRWLERGHGTAARGARR